MVTFLAFYVVFSILFVIHHLERLLPSVVILLLDLGFSSLLPTLCFVFYIDLVLVLVRT